MELCYVIFSSCFGLKRNSAVELAYWHELFLKTVTYQNDAENMLYFISKVSLLSSCPTWGVGLGFLFVCFWMLILKDLHLVILALILGPSREKCGSCCPLSSSQAQFKSRWKQTLMEAFIGALSLLSRSQWQPLPGMSPKPESSSENLLLSGGTCTWFGRTKDK